MTLRLFLLVAYFGGTQSGLPVGATANGTARADKLDMRSVCEVLSRPQDYVGQAITIEGVFTQGVHGMYFESQPKCEQPLMIRVVDFSWRAYRDVRRQKQVLATADGKFIVHHQTPEPMIGKPPEVFAFSVTDVANVRRVPVRR